MAAPKASRVDVYAAIDSERKYQDEKRGNSARDDVDDNRDFGSLLVFIETYLNKAKAAYSGPSPSGRVAAVKEVRKVAALGVLLMELNGAPLREEEGVVEKVEVAAKGVLKTVEDAAAKLVG